MYVTIRVGHTVPSNVSSDILLGAIMTINFVFFLYFDILFINVCLNGSVYWP